MPVAEVQLKSFENPRKLGQLIASLGLESRVIGVEGHSGNSVITNSSLSQQRLATKAEFLQGLVDGLLVRSDWKKVVDYVFKKSSLSELYDGNTSELLERIKQTVKPTDFSADSLDRFGAEDVGIVSLIIQNGGSQILYDLALREDFDYRVSETLLFRVKENVGEEKYKAGIRTIASRIQKEHPDKAVKLFEAVEDYKSIKLLYDSLKANFSLDNLHLLVSIIKDKWWKVGIGTDDKLKGPTDDLKEIVNKALQAQGREDPKRQLGKYLFGLLLDGQVTLDDENTAEVRRLTVLNLDKNDFNPERSASTRFGEKRQPYKDLELDWAKVYWQEEPIFAYKLFLEHKYDSKEVIDCAEKAVRQMHVLGKHHSQNQETPNITLDHLAQVLTILKPEELELRQSVALRIKYALQGKELDEKTTATLESARTELRNLSLRYKELGENKEAYRLWFEGNGSDDHIKIQEVREKLFGADTQEIAGGEKANQGIYTLKFNWLEKKDNVGYKLICERFFLNRPYVVYLLAKQREDEAMMTKARDHILSRSTPEETLKLFTDYTGQPRDQIAYDYAVASLSKHHGVSGDDLALLITKEEKSKGTVL